ncbi:MAG: PEP-CTERM sorting domain-containing protein [Phycisphaeraceae bacterium]|nr:PEP-CTERM sorting domain-containing protein [Phycisphaeraceae bacterium]
MVSTRMIGAAVLGLGISVSAANATQYVQISGFAFGTPIPAEAMEFGPVGGFGGQTWDFYGRTIETAEPTDSGFAISPLESIQTSLWFQSPGDADLFKIRIDDPDNFSAVNSSNPVDFDQPVENGFILALFDSEGNAVAAARGGNGFPIDSSFVSEAGVYYIGLGSAGAFPRNDAGELLFDIDGAGVFAPNALADTKLSSDPRVAWTVFNNEDFLLGTGSFTPSLSDRTIFLTGSTYFIPEPASVALLGLGGLALLARRRNG